MVSESVRLPAELVRRMRQRRDVAWDEVLESAVQRKLVELDALDRIAAKSRLTGDDAERLGHLVKAGQLKRHQKAAPEWR